MNYTKLSVDDVRSALVDVAQDAERVFGRLDEEELNWRPDATRWSIAQCFDHLVRGNALVLAAAMSALEHPPSSVWQRLPGWPAMFGSLLIRSQGPDAKGKYTAPAQARPTTSEIPGDIVDRFIVQHRDAEQWTRGLDQRAAARAIMISPFIRVVTYSVLDGLRLLVAHDRRHFEQARRVLQSAKFAQV